MTSSLENFLNPRSIALLGATPDETKLRGRIAPFLIKNGYAGQLFQINPSHKEIHGRPCYATIGDVPGPVDLAIIVVPAEKVIDALEQCVTARAHNALIMSSGFAEEGGAQTQAQDRIAEIARQSGIRICGPNAEGFHNDISHISATFSPAVDLPAEKMFTAAPRRCGVIAQSGGIGFALYHRGRMRGLRFSQVVTIGNEADLTAAEFLDHMISDPDTSTIVMFLETVRAPKRFVAALERAAKLR